MEKLNFSFDSRSVVLEQSEKKIQDVIIIGGGITGAGCLRDAASRGMNALLLEQNDFASGTSGYSSKLIHGGLRYLETGDIALVFESLRERSILLRNAPTLVKPLPFLYPVYRSHRRPLSLVVAGTHLYHLLTLFRGHLPGPRVHLRKQTLALEPTLRPSQLVGSVKYFDALTNDVDLTIATLQDSWEKKAYACNYANVEKLIQEQGRICGVVARDTLTNKTYTLRSRWVINATGPWSDKSREELLRQNDGKLRMTKGVHLVLHRKFQLNGQAVLMISPLDQRVTFAIPWMGHVLVGTTDTDYSGDPGLAAADQGDIDYLIETYRSYFPENNLTKADVISSFAGIRPLIRQDKESPSNVSREHMIFSEKPGFVSVIGGKLTSYRKMSSEVLDWVVSQTEEWKQTFGRSCTEDMPLRYQEYDNQDFASMIEHQMACTEADILMRRNKLHYLDPMEASRQHARIEKQFRSLTKAENMIE